MNANEMTKLETHLRSWVPRRPSRTLKQQLFPRPAACRHSAPASPLGSRLALSWLTASAAAALLVILIRLPQPAVPSGHAPRPFVAVALSNQAAVATLYAASSNQQYAAPAPALALTNLRPLTSSFSPRSLTTSTN